MVSNYYKKLAESYNAEKENLESQISIRDTIIAIDNLIIQDDKNTIKNLEDDVQYYKTQYKEIFNFLLKTMKANFWQKFMFVFFGKDIK